MNKRRTKFETPTKEKKTVFLSLKIKSEQTPGMRFSKVKTTSFDTDIEIEKDCFVSHTENGKMKENEIPITINKCMNIVCIYKSIS